MEKLTLEQTRKIMDVVLDKAHEMKLNPMAVAVLDDTGQVKGFLREDKTALMRFAISFGKAYACLGMGRSSRALENLAGQRPHFVNSLMAAAGGAFIPVAGGVIIHDADGNMIGAVGVTGDSSDNDEVCAIAGIEAVGLVPVV